MNDEIAGLSCQIEELKRQLSEARRRAEPEPIRNYELTSSTGEPVTLSELFGDKADLLVVHNMGRGCRYCTMWADGFASMLGHIDNRTAFVVVSPDEPEVQQEFAASRGWPFRTVSAAGTTFIQDLGFAHGNDVMPGVSALHKRDDGTIVRTGRDEFGPGDDYAPAWRFFDLLEGGAGGWEPQYRYR
jgi:predicted dithiol-disulfide oxidoreductase (DUF899 family)